MRDGDDDGVARAASHIAGILGRFPVGYRRLAYLQTQVGYDVKRDMPGLEGPEVEALYRDGAGWISRGSLDARLAPFRGRGV